VRVYLNTSALNRPFDDLSVARVRFEAEAVRLLIAALEAGEAELVSSEYLTFEVGQTPDADRVHRVTTILRLASRVVGMSPSLLLRARALATFGLRGLDALHIASAEAGGAQMLVTTDDRMLRRAERARGEIRLDVLTPVQALARLSTERET